MQDLKNIDWLILINLIAVIYSNYYGIWSLINYLNDRDNRMMNSQLFFSITELVPSIIYFKRVKKYSSCNQYSSKVKSTNNSSLLEVYMILFVSLVHIFLAIGEKILWGFILFDVEASRNLIRDFNLIISDLLGVLFYVRTLYYDLKEHQFSYKKHFHFFKYGAIISFLSYIFYKKFCKF